jgi:drug/metabolite transporter (DMT)-like permease
LSKIPQSEPQLALAAASAQTAISVANYFIAHATVALIPPLVAALLRFVGSALLLLALLLLTRRNDPHPRLAGADLLRVCGLGLAGVTLNQTAFLYGISLSTPARSALIYAVTPLLVLLAGRLRGRESLGGGRLAGVLLALFGVGLVLSRRGGLHSASLLGDVVMIGGTFCWAAYTAFGQGLLRRYGTIQVTAVSLSVGSIFFLPVGIPAALGAELAAAPPRAWAGVAWLIVVNSVVSYLCWSYALRRLPPSRVAIFNNLQPPLTVAVAWAFFGETLSAPFLIGLGCVLGGLVLTQGLGAGAGEAPPPGEGAAAAAAPSQAASRRAFAELE